MTDCREAMLLRCTCGELVRGVHVDDASSRERWVRTSPDGEAIHVCPDDLSANQSDLWARDDG